MKRTQSHNIHQHNLRHSQNINIIGLDLGRQVGITKAILNNAMQVSSLSLNKAMAYVMAAAGDRSVPTLLVVGYPITLCGKRAVQARAFDTLIQTLRTQLQVPVLLWDERLSSKWGNMQHAAAAANILQSFLKFVYYKW
ncbi:Putative pre-16S rRNA nuclease [Candidatus Hodgkinia cicadicola]|nr:Putative pre-16S rRNA nuclease [Candidatus Hodgkinia cicadicola]